MKRPSFQFYPGDWLNDASLRMVSVGARGLWIEMMCIMHQGSSYGYLKVNSKVILPSNLARMTGATSHEVEGYLEELESSGVFSRDDDGCIFSRRMIRDEKVREARAAGGSKGGNPALMGKTKDDTKVGDKVNLPTNLKPTPSSSSSASPSKQKPPIPPKGGETQESKKRTAIALKTFLENCRSTGEKPIPETDTVFDYATKTCIPSEFLRLHWFEFKARYADEGSKRYKDWRAVFRKSVRGNWFKLWWISADGACALTTVGEQAKRAHGKDAA